MIESFARVSNAGNSALYGVPRVRVNVRHDFVRRGKSQPRVEGCPFLDPNWRVGCGHGPFCGGAPPLGAGVAWVVPVGGIVCGCGGPVDWPVGVPVVVVGGVAPVPVAAWAPVELGPAPGVVEVAGSSGVAGWDPGGGAMTSPPASGRSGSRTSM